MKYLRWSAIYTVCIFVVVIVRIGLWVTTYQRIYGWLVRPCPHDPQPEREHTVARIVHAVERMARLIPDATCLTQTISAQAVLSWKGIPSTISMGLRKGSEDDLRAHAWLVWNGRIVLEGDEGTLSAFTKMLDLPTPLSPTIPK